ncbi:hypothetical protein R6Q57_022407, partial [Mikania cordata]
MEFLHEIMAIDDELALTQSQVPEEDLIVHILSQPGDGYNHILTAFQAREKLFHIANLLI